MKSQHQLLVTPFVIFLYIDGAAYTLGRINRDCWYLYTLDEVGVSQPDQTVEVSLQNLV
ncbi:hypothetical protein DPMN_051003 [Dreissena polymorpha]|uniref:Uncharacterized protein n=1 Tax=Dreissena polymorpha TaxID=45954 RepID=A0A9D4CIM6_DREPO|nr:hypothetical protein DPMN_051003 [Dreissena polymorpha]